MGTLFILLLFIGISDILNFSENLNKGIITEFNLGGEIISLTFSNLIWIMIGILFIFSCCLVKIYCENLDSLWKEAIIIITFFINTEIFKFLLSRISIIWSINIMIAFIILASILTIFINQKIRYI